METKRNHIRKATQKDLDDFHLKQANNPDIYPYMNATQFSRNTEVFADDWNGIDLIYGELRGWLRIQILRDKGNTFVIGLYAEKPHIAGKLMLELPKLIKKYDAMAVKTSVHESNVKSLRFNRKHFKNYGVEPKGLWNQAEGVWENAHLFKKILR